MERAIDMVLVIDLGGPYSQELTRRIRQLGVYSELAPHHLSLDEIKKLNPKGIILSGGPKSIHDQDAAQCDPQIFDLDIPLLGIGYGMQLLVRHEGGRVVTARRGDYGQALVSVQSDAMLFEGLAQDQVVWLGPGDLVQEAPQGYRITAVSTDFPVVAMEHVEKKRYGVMFHPEVNQTVNGLELLKRYLFNVCRCQAEWTMAAFIDQAVGQIRRQVGSKNVLCALSGGVDSSVVATLVHKAVGDQLTCVFVDHGLLRKGEAESVLDTFANRFRMNVVKVDARQRFLNRLKGVTDPEEKRKIIGNEFIYVFEEEASRLEEMHFLAQGTLYTDIIESGSNTGKAIKSHHNVGGLPDEMKMELIEPLKHLFKDEVRQLGEALGLPEEIVWRQPFPGPGLAIRILGEVTEEKLAIIRESDYILREEIKRAGLDREIWQYFTTLPNIRSVGVREDARTYDYTVAIRAVTSVDGTSAQWARIPYDILDRIVKRICTEVPGVNRVVYDITSKPPATIEWE